MPLLKILLGDIHYEAAIMVIDAALISKPQHTKHSTASVLILRYLFNHLKRYRLSQNALEQAVVVLKTTCCMGSSFFLWQGTNKLAWTL